EDRVEYAHDGGPPEQPELSRRIERDAKLPQRQTDRLPWGKRPRPQRPVGPGAEVAGLTVHRLDHLEGPAEVAGDHHAPELEGLRGPVRQLDPVRGRVEGGDGEVGRHRAEPRDLL